MNLTEMTGKKKEVFPRERRVQAKVTGLILHKNGKANMAGVWREGKEREVSLGRWVELCG